MEDRKNISDFNIWKILGVIPNHFNDQHKKVKVRCPLHHDQESSLLIDSVNELSPNANYYSSSKCYVCADNSNYNVAKYWLKEIGLENNNENWRLANSMFFRMRNDSKFKPWWHANNNYTNNTEPNITIRSYEYSYVRQVVLEIFDEEHLKAQSPNDPTAWEKNLIYLTSRKEIGVEKQNQYDHWKLYFKTSFGLDMIAGGVRYDHKALDPSTKAMMDRDTPTGMLQPFYIQEEAGLVNPDNVYDSNVIHTRHNTLFITEGQKDMLTLRLLGFPAFTLTGGARAKIKFPEFFTNKNVYIIYDNDKAGYEGSTQLALDIAPFAKEVRIATNVFHDMDNKEDIFDFFFKYKNSKTEFLDRLKDVSNFEVYNKAKILEAEREKLLEVEKQRELKKIEQIKEDTKHYKIDFQSLFAKTEPHSIVQFNARLDEAEASAAKTIYLRPIMDFNDHRSFEAKTEFNLTPFYKKFEDAIQQVNDYAIETTGKAEFIVKKQIGSDSNGNELYKNFSIERLLDERNIEVIEAIINTPSYNEGKDYAKTGIWNKLKTGIDSLTRSINRHFKNWLEAQDPDYIIGLAEKQGIVLKRGDISFNEQTKKLSIEKIPTFISRKTSSDSPINILTTKFNKKHTIDFTKARLYEDHEGKHQGEEDTSGHQAIYKALLPSHLITSKTRIGSKVTIYGGKMKDLKSNEPFILAWHFEYRNEIDDFELTDEVKKSLDKFRFTGETLEELEEHQEKLYLKYRKYHKQSNMLMHLWESVDLTFNSIARSLDEDGTDYPKDKNTTLDIMIAGDSTVGKSYTTSDLSKLYGVGDELPFEGATEKALIGGSDTGNKNKLTLGRIPRNHRGLIALEELSAKQFKQDRIGMIVPLHDLRRDGDVDIARVSGDIKVRADVRMIIVSNPINNGGKVVGTQEFITRGLWDMVRTLLDNNAILTRFSFVYCPTSSEHARWIDNPESRHHRANVDKITKDWDIPEREDYRNKIMWVWSRAPKDAVLTLDIKDYTRRKVRELVRPVLGDLGGRDIGIYSDNTTDKHIMSIALALAAATVSTDETYTKVILKEVHIDYAIKFLLKIYNEKYTGIPSYLKRLRDVNNVGEKDLDSIFGRHTYSVNKLWKNKMLTLHESNDKELRHSLFEIYDSIYEFMVDARGNSRDIAWKHYNDMFKGMALRYNQIKSLDTPDPSLAKFPGIQNTPDMRDGDEFKIAWQQVMVRLKLIKNHPTKQFIFSVEPKFMKLYADIKDEYLKKYDQYTGDPIVQNNGEFDLDEGGET